MNYGQKVGFLHYVQCLFKEIDLIFVRVLLETTSKCNINSDYLSLRISNPHDLMYCQFRDIVVQSGGQKRTLKLSYYQRQFNCPRQIMAFSLVQFTCNLASNLDVVVDFH